MQVIGAFLLGSQCVTISEQVCHNTEIAIIGPLFCLSIFFLLVGNDCQALVSLTQVVVARTHFVRLFSNLEKVEKDDCQALVNLTQVVVATTHFVSLISNLEKEEKDDCQALVNLTQVVVATTHFVSLFSNLEKEEKVLRYSPHFARWV